MSANDGLKDDSAVLPSGRPRSRLFLWVGALAVILCILLHESLFFGKGLVPADGVLAFPPWNDPALPGNYLLADQFHLFLPQHEFQHQQFMHGHFPLWNPGLDCGVPNVGSIQGALLFPINLLLLPLDPFYAAGLAAFLKLLLAGWFTMLYLRLLGASPPAAFLSGMVFSVSGFMIVWLGHPHVNCAMWLPLLFYFVEKTFRQTAEPTAALLAKPALRAWAGFSVAFAFALLGGHPPTAIQITLLVLCYFAFRLGDCPRRQIGARVALLGAALAIGVLLAAPQLLTYLEYYRHSSTSAASVGLDRWAERLPPNGLIYFLLPHLSGSPVEGFEDMTKLLGLGTMPNFNEHTAYVGILPLMLALVAVTCRRCKFSKFFGFLILVSLVVVLGVPPLPALFHAIPVLRDINEVRLLLFVIFGVAVLAGLGWDAFCHLPNQHSVRRAVLAFWILVGAALSWLGIVAGPRIHNLDSSHAVFFAAQFFIVGGGLAATIALAAWRPDWNRRVPVFVCLGWTAADLLWFGTGYNPAIPHDRYYPTTPAIQWLQRDTSTFRILGAGTALVPNTAPIFGLSDARGCDFTTVRRYEELITGTTGNFYFYDASTAMPAAFALLNVKYVLSASPLSMDPALFDLVYTNEINIYRYRLCEPRASLVANYIVDTNRASVLARVRAPGFDPQHAVVLEKTPEPLANPAINPPATESQPVARIISYQPDDISIEASVPRQAFLLLLDTYFPGWTATVNGRPARIYRADYNFRAVALPPGQFSVRFSYRPASFRIGLTLMTIGLIALMAACFWPRKICSGGL